ncbi:MAG: hypothetical protein ACRDQZ_07905, partial [Mycobacteriales bacterium]
RFTGSPPLDRRCWVPLVLLLRSRAAAGGERVILGLVRRCYYHPAHCSELSRSDDELIRPFDWTGSAAQLE